MPWTVTSSVPEPMDETHGFNLVDAEPYVQAKVAADEVVDELRTIDEVLDRGTLKARDYAALAVAFDRILNLYYSQT